MPLHLRGGIGPYCFAESPRPDAALCRVGVRLVTSTANVTRVDLATA